MFNITEGPKVRVRYVDFTGQNELACAARLRTQIDTAGRPAAPGAAPSIPALIDNDVIKLEKYYRNNGYLNVRVSRELQLQRRFPVRRYRLPHPWKATAIRVHDWTVQGTPRIFHANNSPSIVTAKKGEYYNENVVTADVRNIDRLRRLARLSARRQARRHRSPDTPGVVARAVLVADRPQSYVGEVIIVGNTVTQDRVIRRMLGLYPGQMLRYPELRIAERNLARLNIFEMNPELGIRPTVQVIDNPGAVQGHSGQGAGNRAPAA